MDKVYLNQVMEYDIDTRGKDQTQGIDLTDAQEIKVFYRKPDKARTEGNITGTMSEDSVYIVNVTFDFEVFDTLGEWQIWTEIIDVNGDWRPGEPFIETIHKVGT